ncbi:MAG: response regulator [Pseudomonadota bacterium]
MSDISSAEVEVDKANILVVDDRPDKLLVFKTVLEELEQNVITVQSGDQALKWLLQHEAAVILLDVNMPGIDGFETAALIRARRKSAHIPIIFVTAYADEMHTARGYSLGAVDYILAPIVADILRSKVKVFVQLFHLNQQIMRQADERIVLAKEQAARAAAEESTRRAHFLAEASKIISSSLKADDILKGVTKLVVPVLADISLLVLIDENGRTQRTQIAWITDAGLETATAGAILDHTLVPAIERVAASGHVEFMTDLRSVSSRFIAESEDGSTTETINIGFPVQHLALHPLKARGRTCAILLFGLGPSGRRFEVTDIALAKDITLRASTALDNCLLYQAIQTADERKNEFLAMLAHELRNPLTAIRHAVDMLDLQSIDQSKLEWTRGVIDRQSKQLIRLVDDLLDVSRITRGQVRLKNEPTDVLTVIAAALETSRPLLDSFAHHLTVSEPSAPVWINGDFARLTQILSNLLNNAAKFTPPCGQIWLQARVDNNEIALSVRDSGMGIQQEMLASIFELFTQANPTLDRARGGLGIGLTVVRQLTKIHGGSVSAFSAGPGLGSEFTVRLPLFSQKDAVIPPTLEKAQNRTTSQRIIVVEDNVDSAEMLAALLQLDGHEVQMAHEGATAIEMARSFRPNVVLLDIGLPNMDGFEVAQRLRALDETKGAILIALTGYGQAEDRQRSKEAGFDHHLVKPLDRNLLTSLLNAHSPENSTKA